jgi:hypothetical protein
LQSINSTGRLRISAFFEITPSSLRFHPTFCFCYQRSNLLCIYEFCQSIKFERSFSNRRLCYIGFCETSEEWFIIWFATLPFQLVV